MRSIVTNELWQVIHRDGEDMVHYTDDEGWVGFFPVFETKAQARAWAEEHNNFDYRIVRCTVVRASWGREY